MDFLVPFGVNWIITIQAMGAWLEAPMKFFSFLGSRDFFFLVLPLVYWSINASTGLRVGFILITSVSFNGIIKLMFVGPRPYWVSDKVIPYVVGLIGVVAFLFGLDLVFPDGKTLIPYIFRYIRYALVGFWVSAGAPWLFFRFKLADEPNLYRQIQTADVK